MNVTSDLVGKRVRINSALGPIERVVAGVFTARKGNYSYDCVEICTEDEYRTAVAEEREAKTIGFRGHDIIEVLGDATLRAFLGEGGGK